MKSLKEFKPLIKLLGEDKKKLIFASVLIFPALMALIYIVAVVGYYMFFK